MSYPIDMQLELLLSENTHRAAVKRGMIRGTLYWRKVFTATEQEMALYLNSHPVPGVDYLVSNYRISPYQEMTNGPKWKHERGKYIIGMLEHGFFEPQAEAISEQDFRNKWIAFLVTKLGLSA